MFTLTRTQIISIFLAFVGIVILIRSRRENLVINSRRIPSPRSYGKTLRRLQPAVRPVSTSLNLSDKDRALNAVKLYELVKKKPGKFLIDKSVRNKLDQNKQILNKTKGGSKVISINGNVYVFDKNNKLLNTNEGYGWCDPNNSRCVAPEQCVEEEVEDGLLGETRWVCKKVSYPWWVILLIVLLYIFTLGASGDDSRADIGTPADPTLAEEGYALGVLEDFSEGNVDNVVVESGNGISGVNGKLGMIHINKPISKYLESFIIEVIPIIPNIRDRVEQVKPGGSSSQPGNCRDCDALLNDVKRGRIALAEYIRCCGIIDMIDLPPMIDFPDRVVAPRPDLIPEIDDEDLPDPGEKIRYRFCQGSDEIRVLQNGERQRVPRANGCCKSECIQDQWYKICGTSYDDFTATVPADSGEFWYPNLVTSEFLDIPCTEPEPCYYPDGRLRDCDSSSGGSTGSSSGVPTLEGGSRNRSRRVRFIGV